MDNLGGVNSAGSENPGGPIPFDEDPNKPIPFDDSDNLSISHSQISLGNRKTSEASKIETPRPIRKEAAGQVAPSERITGVKTFFTKLHSGAIEFLDEQITSWLKKNPDITVKRTNTVAGDVIGKKTEPNIIVTIWY